MNEILVAIKFLVSHKMLEEAERLKKEALKCTCSACNEWRKNRPSKPAIFVGNPASVALKTK